VYGTSLLLLLRIVVVVYCVYVTMALTISAEILSVIMCIAGSVTNNNEAWGRCNSRDSSFPEGGQVCWPWPPLHLWANCGWDLRRFQRISSPPPGWSWKEDLRSINTGEARETSYVFQRISVLVQRFNAVLLHEFAVRWQHRLMLIPSFVLLSQCLVSLVNGVPRVKRQ